VQEMQNQPLHRILCDSIAGMTDRFSCDAINRPVCLEPSHDLEANGVNWNFPFPMAQEIRTSERRPSSDGCSASLCRWTLSALVVRSLGRHAGWQP